VFLLVSHHIALLFDAQQATISTLNYTDINTPTYDKRA